MSLFKVDIQSQIRLLIAKHQYLQDCYKKTQQQDAKDDENSLLYLKNLEKRQTYFDEMMQIKSKIKQLQNGLEKLNCIKIEVEIQNIESGYTLKNNLSHQTPKQVKELFDKLTIFVNSKSIKK